MGLLQVYPKYHNIIWNSDIRSKKANTILYRFFHVDTVLDSVLGLGSILYDPFLGVILVG